MTEHSRTWRRYLPPAGPIISLLLIGLVLLSALLYYRAVKIQRFLEPALALSQPRNEFSKRINETFRQGFGDQPIDGLRVRAGSVQMQKSLVFHPDGTLKREGKQVLRKLSRFFLALLNDDKVRSEIDRIIIVSRFAHRSKPGANVPLRMQEHLRVGFIQDALFLEVPELGKKHAPYFLSATGPLDVHAGTSEVVDFLIIPSEYLHIEVLERLEKYTY